LRKYRKLNRNSGLEYITNKGKVVKARSSEPLKNCRAKCNTKIDTELRENLFKFYWSMKCFTRRVTYISGLIQFTEKTTTRKRRLTPEKQKIREKTYHYYVPKHGNLVSVCKMCFLKIFGETTKFVRNVCAQKLNSPVSNTSPDKRGKSAPANKISYKEIMLVKDHLKSLPTYESHYCRKETSKKYLPPFFTLQAAYDEYKKSVETPVSRTIYEKYFKASGLKAKNPKKDTCALCDRIHMQLSNIHITADQKTELISEQTKHQNQAEQAYESKRNDSVCTTKDKKCVLAFDLQQCLPTPSLESSVVFYKRQLWTYNLTVHNIISSSASCYIWSEPIAKRGASDISSCVFDFLKKISPDIEHVVMYSDCCSGQNKNNIFMAMCLWYLEQDNSVKTIDHKFMVPGHTRMECDSDHARIEKARKRYSGSINHPNDWTHMIRWAGGKKFEVIDMHQSNFFDFSSLLKTKYKMSKLNTVGDKFVFQETKWLRYIKGKLNTVYYKNSLTEEEDFLSLDLSRKKVKNSAILPNTYSEELPITTEKKKDLLSLLPLIPEVFHQYYINLKTKTGMNDPIISDDED